MIRITSRCIVALLTLCVLFPSVGAQRKRTRRATFPISAAKIRADVVGKTVEKIPNTDGNIFGSWTFAKDELKEVDILEKRADGNYASVVVNMKTGDESAQLNGKLRLHYEQIVGVWELTNIENITFKFVEMSANILTPENRAPLPENNAPNQPHRIKLISTQFAVPPNYYNSTQFVIPTTASFGRIVGRFRAVQGQNIKVHVVDADGLENLRNRSQFSSYYSTGQVTVGTINLQLRPGLYFLVFENFYSVFSNKIVHADVDLEY